VQPEKHVSATRSQVERYEEKVQARHRRLSECSGKACSGEFEFAPTHTGRRQRLHYQDIGQGSTSEERLACVMINFCGQEGVPPR
jgi:hypothetical protein